MRMSRAHGSRRLSAVLLLALAATLAPPSSTSGRLLAQAASGRTSASSWLDAYREPASRRIGEALASPVAWERLALMTDTFGNRLSGSQSLEDTIRWSEAEM